MLYYDIRHNADEMQYTVNNIIYTMYTCEDSVYVFVQHSCNEIAKVRPLQVNAAASRRDRVTSHTARSN